MEETDAKNAYAVCKELIDNIKKVREISIKNIPLFEEIYEKEYYKVYLGDEKASWSAFLGDPDILYSRSNVNTWIRIKKKLIDEYGFKLEDIWNIKLSKLETVALYSTSKEHAEELLGASKTLLPSDWKDLQNSLRGKPTSDDGHMHDFTKFEQCRICGLKERCDGHGEEKK